MNDLKFALRQLLKNPGFTITAVLTLALGIGANSAIFTILNSLLFRPVPVERPESIVRLHTTDKDNSFYGHMSYPDYQSIRDQAASFDGVIASSPGRDFFLETASREFGGADAPPEKIRGALVSENYFDVLGGAFSLGRGFSMAAGHTQDTNPEIILSHDYWRRRFNGNRGIVGESIRLNGVPFTIAGVRAAESGAMRFDRTPDAWVPLAMQPQLQQGESWLSGRDRFWLQVDGRLKQGVTLEAAQSEIRLIAGRLAEARQGGTLVPFGLTPGKFLDPEDRQKLLPLAAVAIAAVCFITLIAGANLANLLLFRAVSRRKEIAVRLSLGASRGRLLQQLFTESALLGLLGACAGLLIAVWLADLLVVLAAGVEIKSALAMALDWRVLAYALLVAGLTVVCFGLAPILQSTKQDHSIILRDEAGGATRGMTRSRLRSFLVTGQVALSLVLLVCSGLMLRTLQRGLTLDTGMDIEKTIAVSLELSRHGYDEPRSAELKRMLIERLNGLPNVRGIAQASAVPLAGVRNATDFYLDSLGSESVNGGEVLAENEISFNFFEVLGGAITRGRMFTDDEQRTRQPVCLITEATAQRLWPGENPLGKRLRRGKSGPALEVIGTIRNSPNRALYEDEADLFVPIRPDRQRQLGLLVRTTDGSRALPGTIVRETRALDPALWPEAAFLADSARHRLRGEATMSWLATALGLLALTLAMTGLYGVLSWLVVQRTREMGIRMALGAKRGGVIQLVLGQGMRLVGVGIGLGLFGTVAVSQVLKGLIYDLSPLDPLALTGATASLALVALLASWLPARRAANLNPMEALRHE